MTISATKLITKGSGDLLMVAGSSLVAFSHGLLRPMYQAAPNNHATTAATITASQFTAEKSMISSPEACRSKACPRARAGGAQRFWDNGMRILKIEA
jgi:hypothetical protein